MGLQSPHTFLLALSSFFSFSVSDPNCKLAYLRRVCVVARWLAGRSGRTDGARWPPRRSYVIQECSVGSRLPSGTP
jgi:hypothetical protein